MNGSETEVGIPIWEAVSEASGEEQVTSSTDERWVSTSKRQSSANGGTTDGWRFPSSKREEGILVRFWHWLTYKSAPPDKERDRERSYYKEQITYLSQRIQDLECERQKLLDRLLLKNGLPPVQAQAKSGPVVKVKQAAYDRAIEQTQRTVEQRKQQQTEVRNALKARGINLGNIDPSVLDELEDEMSM